MIGLTLLLLTGVLVFAVPAPWWLLALVALPALLWAPGEGWARRLRGDEPTTALQHLIDSCWAGMAFAWLDLALVRELGLEGSAAIAGLLVLAGLWSLGGHLLARGRPLPRALPTRELIGVAAVVVCVLGTLAWRHSDVVRPLEAYWWAEGATDPYQEPLLLEASTGLGEVEVHGWEEAGAWSAPVEGASLALVAPEGAQGRVVLALRGPLGTRLEVGDQGRTVDRAMVEEADEGPVDRYLSGGVAALVVEVDLEPGEGLELRASEGERLYVLPGSEAVWALHASGELRYVHYYQLLNQVENQNWASELLVDRRFTWNQPPGWSPLLAHAALVVMSDLPGSNALFLWVLLLVGLSEVRLASVLAPGAPGVAWLLPGLFVASHGLLMLEPMSANFPDSLYAAAVLYLVLSLALERTWGVATAGLLTGMLRWPGVVVATMAIVLWRLIQGSPALPRLGRLWGLTLAAALVVGGFVVAGEIEDLGFILWFETFPEHWHGDYEPGSLLPRIPDFYWTWVRYTGGSLVLCLLMAAGRPTPGRRALWMVMGLALSYSLFLCTIDHHPTHYFLPLVALTATGSVIASSVSRHPILRVGFSIFCALGLWIFLRMAQV